MNAETKKTEKAIELIASTTKRTEAIVLDGCVIAIANNTLGRLLSSSNAQMDGNIFVGLSKDQTTAVQALLTPLNMMFALIETAKMFKTKNVKYVLEHDGMIKKYTREEESPSIEIDKGVKCVHTWARFDDEKAFDNFDYKVYIQLTADQVDIFYRIFSRVKESLGGIEIEFVEEFLSILTSYYLPKV